jgi:hypothetical protein
LIDGYGDGGMKLNLFCSTNPYLTIQTPDTEQVKLAGETEVLLQPLPNTDLT